MSDYECEYDEEDDDDNVGSEEELTLSELKCGDARLQKCSTAMIERNSISARFCNVICVMHVARQHCLHHQVKPGTVFRLDSAKPAMNSQNYVFDPIPSVHQAHKQAHAHDEECHEMRLSSITRMTKRLFR